MLPLSVLALRGGGGGRHIMWSASHAATPSASAKAGGGGRHMMWTASHATTLSASVTTQALIHLLTMIIPKIYYANLRNYVNYKYLYILLSRY